jgi:hypothetical protein
MPGPPAAPAGGSRRGPARAARRTGQRPAAASAQQWRSICSRRAQRRTALAHKHRAAGSPRGQWRVGRSAGGGGGHKGRRCTRHAGPGMHARCRRPGRGADGEATVGGAGGGAGREGVRGGGVRICAAPAATGRRCCSSRSSRGSGCSQRTCARTLTARPERAAPSAAPAARPLQGWGGKRNHAVLQR